MRYRSKPVVIDAWLIKDIVDNYFGLEAQSPHVAQAINNHILDVKMNGIHIKTLEGGMFGRLEDWLIMGTIGEFYPCKPDVFEAKYEEI